MRTIFAVLLLSLAALAQSPAENYTHGHFNGRFWNQLTDNDRGSFVLRYREAFSFYSDPKYANQFPSTSTAREFSDGVTEIYKDPANRAIPIIGAMEIFAGQVRGDSAGQIDEFVRALRKMAQAPETPAKK